MPPSRARSTWTGGTISGAASHDLRQRRHHFRRQSQDDRRRTARVNLNGTTTWSGNTANNNNAIRFWNGATINNNGTFNDSQCLCVVHRAQRRRPAQLQQQRHLQQAVQHRHDRRSRRGLQQLGNTQPERRDDAVRQRHPRADRHGEGGQRRDVPATTRRSTVGNMITAGNPGLADRTLTVHIDYDNANFGVGNAFNRRANVTTSGWPGATPARRRRCEPRRHGARHQQRQRDRHQAS